MIRNNNKKFSFKKIVLYVLAVIIVFSVLVIGSLADLVPK